MSALNNPVFGLITSCCLADFTYAIARNTFMEMNYSCEDSRNIQGATTDLQTHLAFLKTTEIIALVSFRLSS